MPTPLTRRICRISVASSLSPHLCRLISVASSPSPHLWQRGWPTKFAKAWHQREQDGGEEKEGRKSLCKALLFVASADQARAASKAKEDEWKRISEAITRERAQAHATRVAHFVSGNTDFQRFLHGNAHLSECILDYDETQRALLTRLFGRQERREVLRKDGLY
jgi:hypothetical protein